MRATVNNLPPGYALPLSPLETRARYQPGHFKYVIIMLAREGKSISERLAQLISHSGAVIMLQESPYRWHFSARFKPWIHCVPLSYSGADLKRKVLWLRSHDAEARQPAMEAMSEIALPEALVPDEPYKLSGKNCVN